MPNSKLSIPILDHLGYTEKMRAVRSTLGYRKVDLGATKATDIVKHFSTRSDKNRVLGFIVRNGLGSLKELEDMTPAHLVGLGLDKDTALEIKAVLNESYWIPPNGLTKDIKLRREKLDIPFIDVCRLDQYSASDLLKYIPEKTYMANHLRQPKVRTLCDAVIQIRENPSFSIPERELVLVRNALRYGILKRQVEGSTANSTEVREEVRGYKVAREGSSITANGVTISLANNRRERLNKRLKLIFDIFNLHSATTYSTQRIAKKVCLPEERVRFYLRKAGVYFGEVHKPAGTSDQEPANEKETGNRFQRHSLLPVTFERMPKIRKSLAAAQGTIFLGYVDSNVAEFVLLRRAKINVQTGKFSVIAPPNTRRGVLYPSEDPSKRYTAQFEISSTHAASHIDLTPGYCLVTHPLAHLEGRLILSEPKLLVDSVLNKNHLALWSDGTCSEQQGLETLVRWAVGQFKRHKVNPEDLRQLEEVAIQNNILANMLKERSPRKKYKKRK